MNQIQPVQLGSTVLLVDDSEATCEAVSTALQDAGFTVRTLNGPFGFIKAVRDNRPRLILIDVGLGTMNGTKLVHLARQHAPSVTKVLLYSGREDAELERDVRDSGADGFISKRAAGDALIRAVRQWTGNPR